MTGKNSVQPSVHLSWNNAISPYAMANLSVTLTLKFPSKLVIHGEHSQSMKAILCHGVCLDLILYKVEKHISESSVMMDVERRILRRLMVCLKVVFHEKLVPLLSKSYICCCCRCERALLCFAWDESPWLCQELYSELWKQLITKHSCANDMLGEGETLLNMHQEYVIYLKVYHQHSYIYHTIITYTAFSST
ncbi:hypothetical protein ATANTOWER_020640 [Ataeniobius toweri]|uniref:Uncharacterized protein n=1 Tax=Ataeniobius toweri TaxID=208326 RepID=A0ABU7CHT0_9TELE|nr:hypothetical protein [Ataeniobius toweri]